MAQPKKVLLITYYWPPAGGAGVQRWLKMSKYLQTEVDLTIYHPENADYPIIDKSLMDEIPTQVKLISQKIREPYAYARLFNGKSKKYQKGQIEPSSKQSNLSKAILWVRANMFVPDARVWWIKPSFTYLKKYIEQHPQDVIITTGPPHSVHLIGLRLKHNFPNIEWIADFRDPWTEIDYLNKLPMTKRSLNRNAKLERSVLKKADVITTVSPAWAENLRKTAGKEVKLIYNGFDADDFSFKSEPSNNFLITYIGSLNDDRNPSVLWRVLDELCKDVNFRNKLRLELIGNISEHVKNEIAGFERLKDSTHFIPYVPHKEAVVALVSSQVLLLLINATSNEKGIIPGKFFEYLAAKRMILCLGKADSDVAKLLEKTKAGILVERTDEKKLKDVLKIWFHEYENKLLNQSSHHNISMYSRQKAALDFLQLIEKL